MLIRPSVTESEGPLAGLDWPYKHEVMGNGIYSSLRFQSSETHQRQQHNCQMLSLGQTEKFTFSGKIFIQRNLAWTWQSCSATHWWDTEQKMWSTMRGWEGLASGGHLIQLQRIKAVVTKGLGEGAAEHVFFNSEANATNLCMFHRCMHCASSNLN